MSPRSPSRVASSKRALDWQPTARPCARWSALTSMSHVHVHDLACPTCPLGRHADPPAQAHSSRFLRFLHPGTRSPLSHPRLHPRGAMKAPRGLFIHHIVGFGNHCDFVPRGSPARLPRSHPCHSSWCPDYLPQLFEGCHGQLLLCGARLHGERTERGRGRVEVRLSTSLLAL